MVLPDFDLKTVVLIPDEIILSSDTELTQYFIKEWYLNFVNEGNLFLFHDNRFSNLFLSRSS